MKFTKYMSKIFEQLKRTENSLTSSFHKTVLPAYASIGGNESFSR